MFQLSFKNIIAALSLIAVLGSCVSATTAGAQSSPRPVAFPGAEGFGKYTTGGRGGKVFVVNNLNDDGAGSLRQAVVAKGPRMVVFSVSGTIHLKSKLNIKGDITIAGQTAPGGGICVADYPVSIAGDNVIIRFMRFRMGDRYQNKGMVDGAGADDAVGGSGRKHVIIDHCSMSWSTDEVCSVYKGDSTTLQWNIIAEPLNYSYHFEAGDKDFEHHGYGGIWGGSHLSAHHNLFAHCNSRTPRFNGVRLGATAELVDFRNNVIYNWGHNNVYGGENGNYNVVNNYYKSGPETNKSVSGRIVNPTHTKDANHPYGLFYVSGNYVEGHDAVSKDNSKGVDVDKAKSEQDRQKAIALKAFAVSEIPHQTALEAYKEVLQSAGALLPRRDTLDQRVINDVINSTGRFIDVQGGYSHGTAYDQTVNAWPYLKQIDAPLDNDQDGMPDQWELEHKLNPNNANDASLFSIHQSYTNIEVYINSLVK
ncbi:pectate lyase family protein [Niabella insulamsoli]|uniref:pectate lyase family protein n=1 Tax=Niabella insulamsoli TaxID=3144874 RepID=UPI0031FD26C2